MDEGVKLWWNETGGFGELWKGRRRMTVLRSSLKLGET
jgi:hypothetical protein